MEVVFEKVCEKHLDMIMVWRNSEVVRRYMYTEDLITPEKQRKWFDTISARGDELHWVIICDGVPVGVVNIKKIDNASGTAEWAFYLGDASARNKGVSVLVEFKIIDFAFNELGLNKLNLAVLDFNERVIEMHAKFGFVVEGAMRQQIKKNDMYYDVVLMGMTKDEWREKREKHIKTIERLER